MISEEERKAIKKLSDFAYEDGWLEVRNAKTVLNLIETQNRMIELMAEYIEEAEIMHKAKFPFDMQKPDGLSLVQVASKQEIEEYFRNKAKESE